MLRVFYSVILIGLLEVCGQYVQSPCPEMFEYKNDESDVYGVIHLQPFGPVTSLLVKVNFTIAVRASTNYAGTIQAIGSETSLLEDFNNGIPIHYRVIFPITSPLPRLTSLSVNENVICNGPGDTPGPNEYVTTIGLQHILYYKPGGHDFRPQSFNPKPAVQPPSDNNVIISYDNPWETNIPEDKPVKPSRPIRPRPPPSPPPSWQTPEWERPPPSHDQGSVHKPPEPEREWQAPVRPATPTPNREPQWPTHPKQPPRKPSIPPPVEQTFDSNSLEECGVNGVDASVPLVYNGFSYERGRWPWLVALFKRRYSSLNYICAGTLVSERHVISAAHCMKRKSVTTPMTDIVVKAGVFNLENWADDNVVTSNLQAAAIHESYNASSLANDILVLTLEKKIKFTAYIRAACLWSGSTDLNLIVGGSGVVAGWGANEFGPAGKGEPRMVRMPVVSTSTCRASKPDFHRLTSSKTLCAGDRNGAGPCLGDSGGGLYLLDSNTGKWRLRGVVSISLVQENGDDSCNLNEYIVFTDTAQYLQWIQSAMNT